MNKLKAITIETDEKYLRQVSKEVDFDKSNYCIKKRFDRILGSL